MSNEMNAIVVETKETTKEATKEPARTPNNRRRHRPRGRGAGASRVPRGSGAQQQAAQRQGGSTQRQQQAGQYDRRPRNEGRATTHYDPASRQLRTGPTERIKDARLEIIPLGGFSEVGRNSVAIRADDEIVILDLGLMMDRYIEYTDSDDLVELSGRTLIDIGAAPDVNILGEDKKNVKGILLTHAHLDHIGAVPYLANRFDCDVHSAPFTIELVRKMFDEEQRMTRGKLVSHELNERFRISEKIEA